MIKLLFLSFLAAASAAPHFDHYRHSPFSQEPHGDFDLQPYFGEDLFDTHRFWQDMESQLRQMEDMISNFHRHFPKTDSSAGVVGNEYKITITLPGFDEKDIIVKAREGVLMVQAVHKMGETERNYLDIRTLPANLEMSGLWTFENEVLNIVFPIKGSKPDTIPTSTTQAPTTEGSWDIVTRGFDDREEMDHSNGNDNVNADVGLEDSKNNAIFTNEIQTGVEATTYSVDLKDEVEFVPVHYK